MNNLKIYHIYLLNRVKPNELKRKKLIIIIINRKELHTVTNAIGSSLFPSSDTEDLPSSPDV